MLVLSRKVGQRILIGPDVLLTVVECKGGKVRLGFDAPDAVEILREEVWNEFRGAGTTEEGCDDPSLHEVR